MVTIDVIKLITNVYKLRLIFKKYINVIHKQQNLRNYLSEENNLKIKTALNNTANDNFYNTHSEACA
jgi:hypothetical protein